MATIRVAVIAGDGIGPEVIAPAVTIAETAATKYHSVRIEWNHLPWSSAYYKEHGHIVPPDGWERLRDHDAVLLGAVGSPDVPDSVTVHELLLPMRRKFDQYVNYRPAVWFEGVEIPLRNKKPGTIDFAVYRENTEGEYAPIGGQLYPGTPHEVAVQSAVFTRHGTERIMRAAFVAAQRRRKDLTVITKSNAQVFGMAFWDSVARAVAPDYPDVNWRFLLVDAAAMDLVRKPEIFDVIVASNLFGDILTDLAAVVTGSIGLGASANMNPERTYPSMFEPIHGSAPDIAGQGIANPMAAILSVGLMLEHLELTEASRAVREAVATVLKAGEIRTPDLGGNANTTQVAEAVLSAI